MLKLKTLCIMNKFLNNLEKWKNVKILKNQNTIENKWSKKLKEIISWTWEEIKEDRIKKSKKQLTDSSLPLSIMRHKKRSNLMKKEKAKKRKFGERFSHKMKLKKFKILLNKREKDKKMLLCNKLILNW